MTSRTGPLTALGLLFAACWMSCGGPSALDTADAGRTLAYEPGLPNFDLEAIARLDSAGATGLDVFLSVPQASLFYVRDGAGFRARPRFEVTILDERGHGRVAAVSLSDTLRLRSYDETQTFRPVVRRERVVLPPGRYVVEAVLVDDESGKQAERRQRVEIPAPSGEAALSRIHLEVKPPGEAFRPQVALQVPTGFDSLRATVQLTDVASGAAVTATLHRLRADTAVATPPFWIAPSRGSLAFRGADLDGPPADTVQTTTREVPLALDRLAVEFTLPPLAEGLYRLRIAARGSGGAEPFTTEERLFAVRDPDFPRVTTTDVLIDALAYLAYPRELAFIREGATAAERRRRFDGFWGTLIGERRTAADALRRYYERVEEANLLFTGAKAGWRTDRGMIYVVFGAPEYVEPTLDGETWHYDYGGGDALSTFVFERATFFGAAGSPFEPYVLVRSPAYEGVWRRTLERWRSGEIL